MDKKRHGHHFTDEPDESGKFKRLEKRRVQEQEDLGFDDEDDALFEEVKKFLR